MGVKECFIWSQLNELYRIGDISSCGDLMNNLYLQRIYLLWVNEIRLITGALSYIHIHNDLGSIRALNKATYQKIYWSFGGWYSTHHWGCSPYPHQSAGNFLMDLISEQ